MTACTLLWLLAAGCGDDPTSSPDAASPDATSLDAGPAGYTVFVNRGGGTYTPGPNDAASNISSIISEEYVLMPYSLGDTKWDEALACLRSTFAAYDLDIVDTEPAAGTTHMEVTVVEGTGQVIGLPLGPSSVSPFSCAMIDQGIAFVFDASVTSSLCAEIAFPIAKMFGLDNVRQCDDISGWRSQAACTGVNDVIVNDLDMTCGEDSDRSCNCGGTTVNSHQVFVDAVGLRP